MQKSKKILLFSLSQFLTFGFYSFILGFLPIYLSDIKLSSGDIAIVNLFGTLISMFGGLLVLQMISPKISASNILKLSSFLSIPSFYLFLISRDFFWITVSWSIFMLFSIFSQTLLDVQLLRNNERGELRYERVRVWGSIGFIFFAVILGSIFDSLGSIYSSYLVLLLVSARSLFCTSVASYIETPVVNRSETGLFLSVLKPSVILLLLATSLNFISHSPLYVYQSLYLRSLGWDASEISLAWNISVIAEVMFFLYFRKMEGFFKLETILVFSLFITSLRWLIMAYTTDFYMLLLSEILHSFSYGGCFLASIRLIYSYFPEHLRGKSQGIFALFGSGLGSLIGRLGVKELGSTYSSYAEYNQMFLFAFWISLLSVVVGVMLLKERAIFLPPSTGKKETR